MELPEILVSKKWNVAVPKSFDVRTSCPKICWTSQRRVCVIRVVWSSWLLGVSSCVRRFKALIYNRMFGGDFWTIFHVKTVKIWVHPHRHHKGEYHPRFGVLGRFASPVGHSSLYNIGLGMYRGLPSFMEHRNFPMSSTYPMMDPWDERDIYLHENHQKINKIHGSVIIFPYHPWDWYIYLLIYHKNQPNSCIQ